MSLSLLVGRTVEINKICYLFLFEEDILGRVVVNSLPASGAFCQLMITFAKRLDPDVGPDLNPNSLTL